MSYFTDILPSGVLLGRWQRNSLDYDKCGKILRLFRGWKEL